MGNLPRQVDEIELLNSFRPHGEIFEIRILREPTKPKTHKGFGFITYLTRKEALNAVKNMHMAKIGTNEVHVQVSINPTRLFLWPIADTTTSEEVLQRVSTIVNGVAAVEVFEIEENPPSKFAILQFHSSQLTRNAQLVLQKNRLRFGEKTCVCGYAEQTQRPGQQMKVESSILFVSNLPPDTSEATKSLFEEFGSLRSFHTSQEFAFLEYTDPSCARNAIDSLDGHMIQDKSIKIVPMVSIQDMKHMNKHENTGKASNSRKNSHNANTNLRQKYKKSTHPFRHNPQSNRRNPQSNRRDAVPKMLPGHSMHTWPREQYPYYNPPERPGPYSSVTPRPNERSETVYPSSHSHSRSRSRSPRPFFPGKGHHGVPLVRQHESSEPYNRSNLVPQEVMLADGTVTIGFVQPTSKSPFFN